MPSASSTSSTRPPAPSLLVLWDIDHTLLDSGAAARAAGADIVLPDLSDTATLLDVLTAHVR